LPATNPAYDVKGNLLFTPGAPAASDALVWDIDNHLSSYTKNGVTTTFTYDALGRRLEKTTGSNSTLFICAGQQVIEEYSLSGGSYSLERSYVYGTYVDDVIAKVEAPGSTGGSPSVLYYHSDRQFNVRGLTGSSGNILELYAYSPYGKQIIMNASGVERNVSAHDNNYGFTGRYLDVETGLWYFRARYFNVEMGRFISRDPLGYVDGMSLYNGYFAEGFGVDPSGLTDGWMHMQTDEEGAQMIQNYRDMSPEGPSVIDHFNPLIDRGDYIDNRKWFEKNYPHWTKFAIKNFSAEILSAITNEYCPSGETEIPNPTAYTVTPYFAGPSNISEGHLTRSPSRFTNETRHGDQPQSAFSADKILGSFVYEVRNIKVKYFKADGERLFAYGAEVVISDGLGFQPHDGYGYWLLGWWWAKPTPVIRAKWRIIGFGICPCEED